MKRLPAEWEVQRSVWLTWPGAPHTWSDCREAVLLDHAYLVAMCSRFQSVDLICPMDWQASCLHHLRHQQADLTRIRLHPWPVDDAWTRDHGPVFVETENGFEIVDLPFNAWGEKYPTWNQDDQIARRVSDLRKLPRSRFPSVGEGGALESNGQGTLVVTEEVWLNPNRNPGVEKGDLEQAFATFFGVDKIVWLRAGMSTDDTDGHVDTLARFVDANRMVVPVPSEDHPDADQLWENHERLAGEVEVIDLPHPPMKDLPLSYANFVILNGGVIVPVYGVQEDAQALGLLQELFPDREVVAVPSQTFLREGGGVHCLTMNEWANERNPA